MGYVDRTAAELGQQVSAVLSIKLLLEASGIIDNESIAATIGSETTMIEMIESLLVRELEASESMKRADKLVKQYQGQVEAHKARSEYLRTLIHTALQQTGEKTMRTALGTVTDSDKADTLMIDDEAEQNVPRRFWKAGDPKIVRDELKAFIVERDRLIAEVAKLSDGSERLAAIEAAKGLKGKEKTEAMTAARAMSDGSERADLLSKIAEEYQEISGVYMLKEQRSLTIRRAQPKVSKTKPGETEVIVAA